MNGWKSIRRLFKKKQGKDKPERGTDFGVR